MQSNASPASTWSQSWRPRQSTDTDITTLVINDSFISSNNPHILINENECNCAMPKAQALGMNVLRSTILAEQFRCMLATGTHKPCTCPSGSVCAVAGISIWPQYELYSLTHSAEELRGKFKQCSMPQSNKSTDESNTSPFFSLAVWKPTCAVAQTVVTLIVHPAVLRSQWLRLLFVWNEFMFF